MCEVHRRTNHATKMDIDGANSLAKTLSSDAHFMDTIHQSGNNALVVQSETNHGWNRLCCEPLLEDMETHLSCLNSSVDSIRFQGPIAQNDAQIRRFRDHGQGKRHVWQEQSRTMIVSSDPFAGEGRDRSTNCTKQSDTFLQVDIVDIKTICLKRPEYV